MKKILILQILLAMMMLLSLGGCFWGVGYHGDRDDEYYYYPDGYYYPDDGYYHDRDERHEHHEKHEDHDRGERHEHHERHEDHD